MIPAEFLKLVLDLSPMFENSPVPAINLVDCVLRLSSAQIEIFNFIKREHSLSCLGVPLTVRAAEPIVSLCLYLCSVEPDIAAISSCSNAASSRTFFTISVRVNQGRTPLTRMPTGPHSTARERVR